MDTFGLGELCVAIGAGRRTREEAIDPRVGLVMHVRIGDHVAAGTALADLHLAEDRPEAVARAAACFAIRDGAAEAPPLILERIG